MKRQWTDPEHVGKIAVGILNKLTAEFHKEAAKPDDERDTDKMLKLAGGAGYQAQIYNGLQKTHDMNVRIKKVEEFMEEADPEKLAMGKNPVLIAEEDQRTTFALR